MQDKIEVLRTAVLKAPHDVRKIEELVQLYLDHNQWSDLYALFGDLAERVVGEDACRPLWATLVRVLEAHSARVDGDPVLAAELLARAGDIAFQQLGLVIDAARDYQSAFDHVPDLPYLDRARSMFSTLGDEDFVLAVLDRRLALCDDPSEKKATLLESVRICLQAGDPDEARRRLQRGLEILPGDPEIQSKLSQLQTSATPSQQEVDRLYARLTQLEAQNSDAIQLKDELVSMMRQEQGRSETAPRLLGTALALHPEEEPVGWVLVEALRSAALYSQAIEVCTAWLERTVDRTTRARLSQILAELEMGPMKRGMNAIQHLREAFSADPQNGQLRTLLTEHLRQQGNWAELKTVYEEARRACHDKEEERQIQLSLALLLWKEASDWNGAEEIFRRLRGYPQAVRDVSAFYEAYYEQRQDWGRLYTLLSQQQAIVDSGERIALAMRMARVAEQHLQSPDKAAEAWKRILSWEPDHAEAFSALRALFQQHRRWQSLLELLTGRVNRLSDDRIAEKVTLLQEIAQMYGDPDKVGGPEMEIHTYGRILQLQSDNKPAIEALSRRYEEAGRWTELVRLLDQHAEITTDPVEKIRILKQVATLWRDQIRNPNRAVTPLETVLSIDADDLEAIDILREIYRAKHNLERLYELTLISIDLAPESQRIARLFDAAELVGDRLHRPEQAVPLWERLLTLQADNAQAIENLSRLYVRQGAWDKYVDLLEHRAETLADGPARLATYCKLGEVLFERLREHERAKAIFVKVIEADPGNIMARAYLQKIHVHQREWQSLEALFVRTGDWLGYIGTLNELAEREEEVDLKVQINMQIARLYEEKLGDPLRALKRYEKAREYAPNNLDLARLLIERYRERNMPERQSEVLQTVALLSSDPQERRRVIRDLIALYDSIGRFDLAFEWCTRSFAADMEQGFATGFDEIEARAAKAEAFDRLATVYAEAESSLSDESMRLAVLKRLGLLCKDHLHDYPRSIDVLREALALQPNDLEVLRALEELYYAASDFEGLEQVLRQRLDSATDFPVIRASSLKLGQLYEDILDDPARAADVFQRLLDSDAQDHEALAGLKRVYERLEDWDALVEIIEKERRLAVGPEERLGLLLQLGKIQREQRSDPETAVAAYEQALALQPGHPETVAILEQMFDEGQLRETIATSLEPVYRETCQWERLTEVLEVRLSTMDVPESQVAILTEIAAITETKIDDPTRAFGALVRLFRIRCDDAGIWHELERLADVLANWEVVATLYAAALGFDDADGQEAIQLANSSQIKQLTVRLARIYEERLAATAEAIDCYRRVLDFDAHDSSALVALIRLYELQKDWENLLEIKQRQADAAEDPQLRRGLLLDVCSVLRDRLARAEEAIAVYRQILDLAPTDLDVMGELETLYAQFERWEDLVALLKRRLEAQSVPAQKNQTRLQLGYLLRDQVQDIHQSIDIFQSVLQADARLPEAVGALEALLQRREHPDFSDFAPRILAILEPLYVDGQSWSALLALYEIRIDLSDDPFEKAQVHRQLAELAHERLADKQRAFDEWCLSFLLNPNDAEATDALDSAALEMAAWSRYVTVLEQGLQDVQGPQAVRILAKLAATWHLRLADPEQAIRWYRRLLDEDPYYRDALVALDSLYELTANVIERVSIVQQRADFCTDSGEKRDLRFLTGTLQLELDNHNAAIEAFLDVLQLSTDRHSEQAQESYNHLELLYEVGERWEDLVRLLLERCDLETGEQQRERLFHAALTYEEQLEAPHDAIALYQRVLDRDRRDEVARTSLRRLFQETERWNDLQALLIEDIEQADDDVQREALRMTLGALYREHFNDNRLASECYMRTIEHDPAHEEALEALQQLLEDDDVGLAVSSALVKAYLSTDNFEKLVPVYLYQLEHYGDQIDRSGQWLTLADLYEKQFSDTSRAFDAYVAAFQTDYHREEVFQQMRRLAQATDRWPDFFQAVERTLDDVVEPEMRIQFRSTVAFHMEESCGDSESAEREYQQILDIDPTHGPTLSRLEHLYEKSQRWENLSEILGRKSELTLNLKDKIELLKRYGALLQERLERFEDAAQVFLQVLNLAPSDLDAYMRLEQIHQDRENWIALVELLERKLTILKTPETRVEVLHRIANVLYFQMEDWDGAVESLARLLAEQPDEGESIALLEVIHGEGHAQERIASLLEPIYLDRQDWRQLIALYQADTTEDRDPERQWHRLEQIRQLQTVRLQDMAGAFETLQRMTRLRPDDAARLDDLAALAGTLNSWPVYAAHLASLAEEAVLPDLLVELRMRQATVAEQYLQRPDDAIAFYADVLEHRNDLRAASDALERLFRQAQRWADLVSLFERQADLSLIPEEGVRAHFAASRILYENLANREGAAEHLEQVLHLDVTNREALRQLEAILTEMQDWPRLDDTYRRWANVADATGERQEILHRLALLLLERLDDHFGAFDFMRTLLASTPPHADTLAYLEAIIESVPEDRQSEQLRYEVLDLVEPTYGLHTPPERWIVLLRVRLEQAQQPFERAEVLRRIGEIYRDRQQDWVKSFDCFRQAFVLDLGNSELDRMLRELAARGNLWESLLAVYGESIEACQDDLLRNTFLLKAARLCRDQLADIEQAATYFGRIIESDPSSVEALDVLEQHRRSIGDHIGLTEVLEKRLEFAVDEASRLDILFTLASLWEHELENPQEAIRWYDEMLSIRGDERRALQRLEAIRTAAGQWPELVDVYQRMLASCDEPACRIDLHGKLADVLVSKIDDPLLAIENYKAILAIDASLMDAIVSLETLYEQVKDWYGLQSILIHKRDQIAEPIERAELDFQLGLLALRQLDSPEEALERFRHVLVAVPDHPATIATLQPLVENDGLRSSVIRMLEPIYERQAQWEKWIELLERRLQDEREPFQAIPLLLRIADLYRSQLNATDAAYEHLGRAYRLEPTSDPTRQALIALASQTETWARLIETLEALLDDLEDAFHRRQTSLWLGQLYEAHTADRSAAIGHYQKVLADEERNRDALLALERLLPLETRWSELADILQQQLAAGVAQKPIAVKFRLARLREGELGQPEVALEIYRDILWEDPHHQETCERLEQFVLQGDLRRRAADVLEPILRQTENWPQLVWLYQQKYAFCESRTSRAQLCRTIADWFQNKLQQPRDAFAWFAKALPDEELLDPVLGELERLASEQQLWPEFAEALEMTLSDALPGDSLLRIHLRLGRLYQQTLDDGVKAVTHLESVIRLEPDHLEGLRLLKFAYEQTGQTDALMRICEQLAATPIEPEERKALYHTIAQLADGRGDDARAVQAYRHILELDDSDLTALQHLELHYEVSEDWQELANVLLRRTEIVSERALVVELKIRFAQILEQHLNRPVVAVAALEDAFLLEPANPAVCEGLQRLYESLQRFEDLRNLLEKSVEQSADRGHRIAGLLRIARLEVERLKDSPAAVRSYQRILREDPRHLDALRELAHLYELGQRWRPLADTLRAQIDAMEPDPERREVRVQLANVLEVHLSDFDGAAAQLRKVIEEHPDHLPALMGLARLKEALEQWTEAVQMYRQLLPQCRSRAETLDSLARLANISLYRLSDFDQARQFLQQARDIDPTDRRVLELLRDAYERCEDWPALVDVIEASLPQVDSDEQRAAFALRIAQVAQQHLHDEARYLQWLKRAQRYDPSHVDTGESLARCLEEQEAWSDLAPVLESLVMAQTERRDFRGLAFNAHRLGKVYERLSEPDRALSAYQLSRQHDASNLDNLKALARLLFERKSWDEALKLYQAMLLQQHRFNEDEKAELFVRLAQVCLAQGDHKRARQYLIRLSHVKKDHPQAQEILAQLQD